MHPHAQARVRKDAPIVGKTVAELDFWANYSVIVIGAELAGKSTSPTTLGELALGPQDLLVFTARKHFSEQRLCMMAHLFGPYMAVCMHAGALHQEQIQAALKAFTEDCDSL